MLTEVIKLKCSKILGIQLRKKENTFLFENLVIVLGYTFLYSL